MSSSPDDGYDAAADAQASYYAAIEAKRQRGDTHWPGKRENDRMLEPAWRLVSPAPASACLRLAGPVARVRRAFLQQRREAQSVAVYRGDDVIAVVMFARHGWRRQEMALAVARDAHVHMRRLVRMAQLTLNAMAETSLIVAEVRPGNGAGERMAAMVGFVPARLSRPGYWIFRKGHHGGDSRRRQRGGKASPAGSAAAAAHRE